MKIDPLHTRLETIIARELSLGARKVEIVGTSSTLPLSLVLSQSSSSNFNSLPHLVVVPSLEVATDLQRKIALFSGRSSVYVLPHFDVSPYSTLVPNSETSAFRVGWLLRAQNAKPGDIFIAPIESLQQKTLPFSVLEKNSFHFRVGDELPSNFAKLLGDLGYSASPLVEDVGQFAHRGGIVDIYSSAHTNPVRIELFGDFVESLRFFSPDDHRTLETIGDFYLAPAHEALYSEDYLEKTISRFRSDLDSRAVPQEEVSELLRSLSLRQTIPGVDFLLPYFYERLESPLNHFSSPLLTWFLDPIEMVRLADLKMQELTGEYSDAMSLAIRPNPSLLFSGFEELPFEKDNVEIHLSKILFEEGAAPSSKIVEYPTHSTIELSNLSQSLTPGSEPWEQAIQGRLSQMRENHNVVFIFGRNQNQSERLKMALEKVGFQIRVTPENELLLHDWLLQQERNPFLIHILPLYLSESLKLDEERLVFLRDEDFFGKKSRLKSSSASKEFQKQAARLSFGDLNPGDFVVHLKHGIGQYDGLKVMSIGGVDSEFIQLGYKDKDKLYLPVYRIGQLQKYSSGAAQVTIDKLGGTSWEKAKTKVKSHLKDLASELLALYAKRAECTRPAFHPPDKDYVSFEAAFPYDETNDQLRAVQDVISDMTGIKPMDRLVCGDVGFGKTEVAMRAAFKAVEDRKQVAVLAPTTVLTFQHVETFKRRFKGWPITIKALNRFLSNAEAKQTLVDLKEGKIDIIIGTHRLLSKDVSFKDLGLLVVDEEQKFGVAHKERIRKIKTSVDTLAMSATPIPRTLNMSLMGVRDLSLITTPPVDRLPTRTFICKFEPETIRKAILAEIGRGGQVYFIHNRIQSIYGVADELRKIVPEARLRIGHGQMDEGELEDTMVAFFNHEIDVLLCTTIVESGMDVSRANTIFIDDAHHMGLSQLYQLRGRVGRSKQRAYCYLIVPRGKPLDKIAQERLKVIQEHTSLGSGLLVAQHDLELRGSGNILGEEQSGHVNLVGYELYMDLLNEALASAKGEAFVDQELDPEITLRIPAMIPDSYISDIRLRLSYYKALASIETQEEVSAIEDELRDQFGSLPEATVNLLGVMLIRSQCKRLGVKDLSAGVKAISLVFTEHTPLKNETAIQLATRENKKYSLTPDSRMNIRMNSITISNVYAELEYLLKLVSH